MCYVNSLDVENNYSEAAKWFHEAAKRGHAMAKSNLGWFYEHGTGVGKNERTAAEWYRKAAEDGIVIAQFHLFRCYESGIGVGKDPIEAAKWFKKVFIRNEVSDSLYTMGNCFEEATAVKRDVNKALYWSRHALIWKHPKAEEAVKRLESQVCLESWSKQRRSSF
jgi:hypothetical protein